MQIIINADDLGASQEVHNESFNLMSVGLVSSATIMANAPFVENAAERSKHYKNISFGIHLNLTAFSPISYSNELKPIINKNGNFIGRERLERLPIKGLLSRAIYSEFCKQVDKLLSFGIHISHIDSHEHIHTLVGVFPILKQLQKKYQIRKVRISRNIYLPEYNISKILHLKKVMYNFVLRKYYASITTSGFGSLKEFIANANKNNLNHKTIEIMVHPGSVMFEEETSILKPHWYETLPVRFELINYNQL